MQTRRLDDREGNWVRQSFLIPRLRGNQLDSRYVRQYNNYGNSLYGAAGYKYTDTTLGGNFAINAPAQFCRFTDLRPPTRLIKNNPNVGGGLGMGRYYSESIDDYAQHIHMRFGVPEFNSLTTFFTGFYNTDASLLARKGRGPGIAFSIGKAAGTIAFIPLAPFIAAGRILRWLANAPASKYYYLRPTMPLYWNAVNTIANTLAVNMGIYPKPLSQGERTIAEAAGDTISMEELQTSEYNRMRELLPDLYWKNGGIDVYAIANRATRLAHQQYEVLNDLVEKATSPEDLQRRMREYTQTTWTDPGSRGIDKALADYANSAQGLKTPPTDSLTAGEEGYNEDYGRGVVKEENGQTIRKPGWYSSLVDNLGAELSDGSAFVTFHVDHTGQASESFSNSVRDSDIAGTINSSSASARNSRFNFAEGNVASSASILGLVEGAVKAATDVVAGVASGLQISGLAALAGSAFVDIPKHWDSSTTNLPTMTYNIQLQAWSGDKFTRFQSLIIPLSMLLAGVLPRSTGKHSYTSPFICELYSKGRAQTRLGIITDMTITRGTGNIGWTVDHEPLGIDISFTVADLSSIMHMPIAGNTSFNLIEDIFSEDTAFNDYLAVLGSLGLSDQIYISKRFRLSLARKMASFRQWTSPAKWANWANGTNIGRLANTISREIDRP